MAALVVAGWLATSKGQLSFPGLDLPVPWVLLVVAVLVLLLVTGVVEFYVPPILRQLHMVPWTEFMITQLQLLSSTDWLANVLWVWFGRGDHEKVHLEHLNVKNVSARLAKEAFHPCAVVVIHQLNSQGFQLNNVSYTLYAVNGAVAIYVPEAAAIF
jgi:hypothetical protein